MVGAVVEGGAAAVMAAARVIEAEGAAAAVTAAARVIEAEGEEGCGVVWRAARARASGLGGRPC